MSALKILFLGKREKPTTQEALEFLDASGCRDVVTCLGDRGDPWPARAGNWRGDLVISYLSPWIVPESTLQKAMRAAINFHPAPPEYPGIGCTNFAIYDGAATFGITCHHMNKKVDTGEIIAVKRFEVTPNETVYSLTRRSYGYMLECFREVMTTIFSGEPLPSADVRWGREPYTRKDLENLARLELGMSEQEIRRRVRAMTYPAMPGAYFEFAGIRFEAKTNT